MLIPGNMVSNIYDLLPGIISFNKDNSIHKLLEIIRIFYGKERDNKGNQNNGGTNAQSEL